MKLSRPIPEVEKSALITDYENIATFLLEERARSEEISRGGDRRKHQKDCSSVL